MVPKRFDARFLIVDARFIAMRIDGAVHSEAELVELVWTPLDEARNLDLPAITHAALDDLALIEPDDAVNAIGRIEATADGPIVVVDDAGRLILGGDPVAASTSLAATPEPSMPSPSTSPAFRPLPRRSPRSTRIPLPTPSPR